MVGGALPHDTSGSMKDVSDSEHILTFCDLSDRKVILRKTMKDLNEFLFGREVFFVKPQCLSAGHSRLGRFPPRELGI